MFLIVNKIMKKLVDYPVLFVHYPKGAGGWFLSSLLHQSVDPTAKLIVDKFGGANDNLEIQQTNNLLYWLSTEIGYQITTGKFEDITYLQESAEVANDTLPLHVISIHCTNINLFLQAFPNSKCIQITVEDDYKFYCLYNWLVKIISRSDKTFVDLCNEYEKSADVLKTSFDNLSMDNIRDFEFAMDKIEMHAKNVPNDPMFDTRILEIDYIDYMVDDVDALSTAILDFALGSYDQKIYDNFVSSMLHYRFCQKLKLAK